MSVYVKKPDGVFWHQSYGRVMEHKGRSTHIFWNGDMLRDLRRHYPRMLNEEVAGMLGVSVRTMVRKARKMGLKKDPAWLAIIWEERRLWAQIASRRKGYPGAFRKGGTAGAEFRFKPGDERLRKGGEIWKLKKDKRQPKDK